MTFFSSAKTRSKALCAGVLALSFCFVAPAMADEGESEQKTSEALLAEYGINQSEVTNAEIRVADAKNDLAEARQAVELQEDRIAEVNTRLNSAKDILNGITKDVENTEGKIKKSEDNVGKMVSDMYKTGGLSTADSNAFSYMMGDAEQITEKAYIDYTISKVTDRTMNSIDERKQLKSVLESSQDRQEAVHAEINALKTEEVKMLGIIEDQRDKAQNEKKRLDGELENAQSLASKAKKTYEEAVAREAREAEELRQRQLEMKRLEDARLAQEKKLMAQAAKTGVEYKPTFVADDGSDFFPLPRPTTSNRVTSSFGFRPTPAGSIDYGGRGGYVHAGIDYGVACGTPVKAVGSGEVFIAGWSGTGGIVVAVDHGIRGGKGFATRYHHLSATSVKIGQKVKRGELLGLSGTTGNSTGCHLHFETLVNGDRKNPVAFFKK